MRQRLKQPTGKSSFRCLAVYDPDRRSNVSYGGQINIHDLDNGGKWNRAAAVSSVGSHILEELLLG